MSSRAGRVVFRKGQLVQVANSPWDYTFKSLRKLLWYWSTPYRVRERIWHSYKLETLQGVPIDGLHSARRLRAFVPKKGSALEAEQRGIEAGWDALDVAEGTAEQAAVERERAEDVGGGLE
ncbi:hypothetical protein R3P38DRAFT_2578632 [Favolaschia claudopus]|uniref:Uncharacterized protein n=1 Tax=Favolaschia claudopus TaxID=2862362 RepID=A0AAV9ZGH9_9AGAR